MKADGASEGIPGLAFVELHGRLPPKCGSSSQSSMNNVRSIRPISRKARARPL
jgi:hypothetical protein